MKARMFLGLCFVIAMLIMACGGSKQMIQKDGEQSSDAPCPGWFYNIPAHQDTLYGVATATSRDLQLAIDQATLNARTNIGSQVENRVKAMAEQLRTEVGDDAAKQLSTAIETVIQGIVNVTLSGSKVKKQSTKREGNLWRSCVLVSYPVGAANKTFLENLKREKIVIGRQDIQDAVQRMEKQINQDQ